MSAELKAVTEEGKACATELEKANKDAERKAKLEKQAETLDETLKNLAETKAEAEKFYNDMMDPKDETPISYGLNTKVIKV